MTKHQPQNEDPEAPNYVKAQLSSFVGATIVHLASTLTGDVAITFEDGRQMLVGHYDAQSVALFDRNGMFLEIDC